MKKLSAAAVKATKNLSQPKLTIGLDLGDRSSWYGLLDEVATPPILYLRFAGSLAGTESEHNSESD